MPDYRVEIADAHAHLWRVTLTLRRPDAQQVLSLPVWVPGSYLVREMARHLSGLVAVQGGRERGLRQIDKTRWLVACDGAAPLRLSWLVYAFDPSVRGAFLDADRGFFNGSSLFLRAEGREGEVHRLALGALPRGWHVATAMRSTGPRRFEAADYDEFIDHPFELGRFWRGDFVAGGVQHAVVVSGAWPGFDGERLLADVQRLCMAQIDFWHPGRAGRARRRPPFDRYLFLLHAAEDGHGGLEHRASSALAAARRDLPRRPPAGGDGSDAHAGLLGLFSHEYFHAWHVKRMQPREFTALDLSREQPSTLLWFFEGFTAYYDDLFLLKSGLVDRARYLRLLARPVNTVLGSPGRQVQSVAAASFDAWTKAYRPDENTGNATVSYYAKGALVALLCDLALRARGSSLDAVMRALWRSSRGGALDEADIADALAAAGGAALRSDLRAWVHGTAELPLARRLAGAGLRLREEVPTLAATLGLKLSEGAFSGVQVRQVLRGSAAEAAGIAAGDELLAVDGWRLRRLDDARQWLSPGAAFTLMAVRDQRLLTLQVQPPAAPAAPVLALLADDNADAAALALRRAWLGS